VAMSLVTRIGVQSSGAVTSWPARSLEVSAQSCAPASSSSQARRATASRVTGRPCEMRSARAAAEGIAAARPVRRGGVPAPRATRGCPAPRWRRRCPTTAPPRPGAWGCGWPDRPPLRAALATPPGRASRGRRRPGAAPRPAGARPSGLPAAQHLGVSRRSALPTRQRRRWRRPGAARRPHPPWADELRRWACGDGGGRVLALGKNSWVGPQNCGRRGRIFAARGSGRFAAGE